MNNALFVSSTCYSCIFALPQGFPPSQGPEHGEEMQQQTSQRIPARFDVDDEYGDEHGRRLSGKTHAVQLDRPVEKYAQTWIAAAECSQLVMLPPGCLDAPPVKSGNIRLADQAQLAMSLSLMSPRTRAGCRGIRRRRDPVGRGAYCALNSYLVHIKPTPSLLVSAPSPSSLKLFSQCL